jgi:hypothetical protein
MKTHLPLLLLTLLGVAFGVHAQNFKVIEDTKDYILKECDSVYYYSHGLPPKDDFVLDTSKIHKVNGVLKLPLDNGKEVVFKDSIGGDEERSEIYIYKGYNSKLKNYLIEQCAFRFCNYFIVNKLKGITDTLVSEPVYSPSYINLGYIQGTVEWGIFGNIGFENLKTHKKCVIHYDDILPYNFKWINDNSFVYYTDVYEQPYGSRPANIYYLLQIKP